MRQCDIVIPVWNEVETTRECIDSIAGNTTDPYRLILIDNGSGVETKKYLEDLSSDKKFNTRVIRNEKNIGFAGAINQGLSASVSPYICLLNNDTIVTSGWLDEMIDVMESNPAIGLLNPSSNTSGQLPGDKSIDDYALELKQFSGGMQELYRCRGFCMLIRREVVEKVGLFDEAYGLGYFEETDYCMRAREKGFIAARAKGAYVYHKEGVSFNKIKDADVLFRENEKVFIRRWGRMLRVGYLVNGPGNKDKVDEIAAAIARSGHQAWVFLKKGLRWPVALDHFDIRRVDVSQFFYGPASICAILKRRKKKGMNIVITDDKILGNILMLTKPLHGAEVIVEPCKEGVLGLLEKISGRTWKNNRSY